MLENKTEPEIRKDLIFDHKQVPGKAPIVFLLYHINILVIFYFAQEVKSKIS